VPGGTSVCAGDVAHGALSSRPNTVNAVNPSEIMKLLVIFIWNLLSALRYSLPLFLADIAFVALLSQHMTALRNPEVFLNFSFRRAKPLATCCKV
jgi:hypothetical protein